MTPRCAMIRRLARAALAAALLLVLSRPLRAQEAPHWLPRYDLDIDLRVDEQRVLVRQRVTWTNPQACPTDRIVFNVASHYTIPDKDVGLLAKTLEILRLAPSEALDFGGPACQIQAVCLADGAGLPFAWRQDNPTALEVPLPFQVGPGQSVTLDLAFTLRLPQKQGRWGQWRGVTFLAQWLPVVAVYDQKGWQPVPFIPWHQPFFNEAGVYSARVTLPADQTLAATAPIADVKDLGDGRFQLDLATTTARDFALVCSAHFAEFSAQAGHVKVRCFCFPEYEYYAHEMLRTVCEALPVYEKWFGRYPYEHFTLVQSFFGWNGNECGALVMVDQRMFNMPHITRNYVDHLISHELCHQWWYNVVGTNGYCETWMDEGLATYFSHRLVNQKVGRNNKLIEWPRGLTWLPNIHREDYRHYGMLGTIGRGEATRTVQDMPAFGHLVNLFSITYERGSKIVAMIEERLGEAAMFDFMRRVYCKYQFRILRVADFQRELEEYTGRSWDDFFRCWVYGSGMCDWCLDSVDVAPASRKGSRSWASKLNDCTFLACLRRARAEDRQPHRAVVMLRQKAQCTEPTVLGFQFDGEEHCNLRVPIMPSAGAYDIEELQARVEPCHDGCVRIEVVLPARPTQVTVDPDQVLIDSNPTNNHWKPPVRLRVTPLYFALEETDLTNAYDRWNIIVGPWLYGAAFKDPWYTRSTMVGLRAGVYRTQEFNAGAYLAYRTDDRNIVAGFDALWDHWPLPKTQVGLNFERSLTGLGDDDPRCSRGVLFGRYILTYGSSLYLPPFEYVEAFGSIQERCLPFPDQTTARADLIEQQTNLGLHYHKYFLTPYWDPEAGMALDATYQVGVPILGAHDTSQQVYGQVSLVKSTPDWLSFTRHVPGLRWVMDTRWAARLFGAAALPDDGLFFALGGGERFRGFDLSQRQGSLAWVGSLEWRIPLLRGLEWDVCDHVAGLRNVYVATFYDVGDIYVNGQSVGPVAHALGAGLRVDVAWFGLIERTVLRFDAAKAINAGTPWQFWFGIMQPF